MSTKQAEIEPRILERSEHSISRKNISDNTVKVLYRLHNAGYKGYLVGGGVRDLLLDRQPKDFDVATDARPEQVRRLFRNSRIIGRRFRLVHVYFQGEIVEVATFRRDPDPDEQDSDEQDLLITSDNTYGTPQEDAFRRDFTINGLFYDIADFTVVDYLGGIDDLDDEVVRCIGDPWVRFREDPVRMLRACEFAGRLAFDIEDSTQKAIRDLRWELEKASTARVTEEIVQLMRSGRAEPAVRWMVHLGLDEVLLPELSYLQQGEEIGLGDLRRALTVVDEIVRDEERELPDAVLWGVLLLPRLLVERERQERKRRKLLSRNQIEAMIRDAVARLQGRFNLSKARNQEAHYALFGFFRLCEPRWQEGERARFARRPYFRDALALFEVLVRSTGEGEEALAAWQRAGRARERQKQGGGGRGAGGSGGGPAKRPPRRRPRRRRR